MLRVLNALFDDRFGGPQRRVIEVGEHLQRKEVGTVLLVPKGDGGAAVVAASRGLECVRVSLKRIPKPREIVQLLAWLLWLPVDVFKVVSVIKERQIDLVHVNGAFFLAPALAAKFLRKPLVWHLNDTVVPSGVARGLGWLVQRLADEVIVAAEAVVLHYGIKGENYHVIHAPVDVTRFGVKRASLHRGRRKRIGLVGNWNPLKGLEVFVQASAIIKQFITDVEFIMAGARLDSHAGYAQDIDQLIDRLDLRENIQCEGFIDDMPQFFRGLDVLVLSSWSEASPKAVLEAMAAGVPVVATDVGGVREILAPSGDDAAGVVVPKADADGIAWQVIRILEDKKLAICMGENGRERANALFSLEKCVENHLAVYRKVESQLVVR